MAKYFISHCEIDEKIADEFQKLMILGGGLQEENIFCSSIPGIDIKSGKDFVDYINKELKKADVIFALFTQNFIESSFCMAEVGASWTLEKRFIPIIVQKDLGFSQTTALCRNISGIKIDDEKIEDENEKITKVAKVINEYEHNIDVERWAKYRKQFIKKLEEILKESKEPQVIDFNEHKKLLSKCSNLKSQVNTLQQRVTELEQINQQLSTASTIEERKIIINQANADAINDFKNRCKDIAKKIQNFSKVVQYIFYMDICHEEASYRDVNNRFDNSDIQDAYNRHFIDDNMSGYKLNHNSIKIQKLVQAYEEFESYINNDLPEEVYNYVIDEYEIEIEIDSLEFWEECLGISF